MKIPTHPSDRLALAIIILALAIIIHLIARPDHRWTLTPDGYRALNTVTGEVRAATPTNL